MCFSVVQKLCDEKTTGDGWVEQPVADACNVEKQWSTK